MKFLLFRHVLLLTKFIALLAIIIYAKRIQVSEIITGLRAFEHNWRRGHDIVWLSQKEGWMPNQETHKSLILLQEQSSRLC